ncbi:hypothetical protein [[Kitasatospora] papulosa]|uniref:hypothetical protein n=1 Tax=[Kitasatospora] papulosa TaxID=1464011 RepID=UPI00385744FB
MRVPLRGEFDPISLLMPDLIIAPDTTETLRGGRRLRPRHRGADPMSSSGYAGISLAGRWECGTCGASGDGWWNEDDGFVMNEDHECEETTPA